MDRLPAIGSSQPAWQAPLPANRDADPSVDGPWPFAPEPDPAVPLGLDHRDPADQQRILHFMSHVNAECFISLLQTMDPMPYDTCARAEYRRYYRQMRESLETPLLSVDPPPLGAPADPVK